MLVMTDWRLAARARCPDIPAAEVERMAPVLEDLEAAFAPLAARIPIEAQPAAVFGVGQAVPPAQGRPNGLPHSPEEP
jgi:hypothetical protein